MKKIVIMLAAVLIAVLPLAAREKYSRAMNDLPQAAQTMIEKNFPNIGVSHIKIDSKTFGGKEYDVVLNNGTEIEFDAKGEWEDIDCGMRPVPAALIPQNIKNYVDTSHKGSKIVKIDKGRNNYEIELDSGLDIVFDKNGIFKRYDD